MFRAHTGARALILESVLGWIMETAYPLRHGTDNSRKESAKMCENCTLGKTAKTPRLWGEGEAPNKVMVVGEAPGAAEDEFGRPFIGASGRLLRESLQRHGLSPYITNVVKCRPPENAKPSRIHVKACLPYLLQEIEKVQPQLIIALGDTASKALGVEGAISKVRGSVVEVNGLKVLPCYHPAYVLRNPNQMRVFEGDLAYAARLLDGLVVDEKIEYKIVYTLEDLQTAVEDLKTSPAISYDIETDGDQTGTRILLVGLARMNPFRSYVIPWEYPTAFLPHAAVVSALKELLEPSAPDKAAQNAYRFDNQFLRARGIRPYLTFDTLLAAHLLDENSPHDLEYLSKRYLGVGDYKGKVKYADNFPMSVLAEYNARDSVYTLKVALAQSKEMTPALKRVFKTIIMPAARMLDDVTEHGVYVDAAKLLAVGRDLLNELDNQYQKLVSLVPEEFKNINPASSQQVGKLLYSALGLTPTNFTASGKPSTSADTLVTMKHPVAEAVVAWRATNKLLTSYIRPWKEFLEKSPDGRFHPKFKVHGTVTGRLSAVDPAIQTVPRTSAVRSVISAPPGWVLVEADYSQIELRIGCSIAQEPTMIAEIRSGIDLHTQTAKDIILCDPTAEVTKEQRQAAKAINFGLIYGMSSKGLMEYSAVNYGVEITLEEAVDRRIRFFNKYPGFLSWHKRVRDELRTTKQVASPLGRIRRFPGYDSASEYDQKEMEREAINCTVQATASDICVLAGLTLHRIMPQDRFHIVNFVHDAILMEVREDVLEEVLPQVKQVMTDVDRLLCKFEWRPSVPLDVEIKIGPWGGSQVWKA